MTGSSEGKVLIFAPGSPEEAAGFFKDCSLLRSEGREVLVGILESPYRPARAFGLAAPLETGLRGDAASLVRPGLTRPSSYNGGIDGRAFVLSGTEELSRVADSIDGGTALKILVTHRGMREIREISNSDLLAVADGGVRYADFIEGVERAGLYFPYEPSLLQEDRTLAEVVMDGEIVSTEGRLGRLREYLLALELATPKGEVIRLGSRSVKDVTGYELTSFIIGAGGLCGMVTRVTLRLLPSPKSRVLFASHVDFGSARLLAGIIHRKVRPSFLEIFEGEAAGLLTGCLLSRVPGLEGSLSGVEDSDVLLFGEIQSPHPDLEGQLAQAVREAPEEVSPPLILEHSLIEERRGFKSLALEALDKGWGIFHLSYDGKLSTAGIPGALIYRSMYPERMHIYAALGAGEDEISGDDAGSESPGRLGPGLKGMPSTLRGKGGESLRRSVPDLKGMPSALHGVGDESPRWLGPDLRGVLSTLRGAGLRERAEVIGMHNGKLAYRRLRRGELDFLIDGGAVAGSSGMPGEQEAPLGRLTSKILEVFDPHGIMIP